LFESPDRYHVFQVNYEHGNEYDEWKSLGGEEYWSVGPFWTGPMKTSPRPPTNRMLDARKLISTLRTTPLGESALCRHGETRYLVSEFGSNPELLQCLTRDLVFRKCAAKLDWDPLYWNADGGGRRCSVTISAELLLQNQVDQSSVRLVLSLVLARSKTPFLIMSEHSSAKSTALLKMWRKVSNGSDFTRMGALPD